MMQALHAKSVLHSLKSIKVALLLFTNHNEFAQPYTIFTPFDHNFIKECCSSALGLVSGRHPIVMIICLDNPPLKASIHNEP